MPTYRLDTKLQFERRIQPVGDFETRETGWQRTFRSWAELRPLQNTERVEAEKLHGVSTHRCIIRHPGREVNPQMRFDDHGSIYQITAVNDIEGRHEYLEIIAKREEPDAR